MNHRRALRRPLIAALTAAACLGVGVAPVSAADGQVSGRVFFDMNVNGAQDTVPATEPGIKEATVSAVDASGAAIASTTTGPDGRFTLAMTNAASDAVRLQITPPEGFTFGPHHAGGGTSVEFVKLGSTDNNVGLVPAAADPSSQVTEVGDRIWRDANGNGLQDAGEPAIAGVTVNLWGPSGVLATAVTDEHGRFFFSTAAGSSTRSDIRGVAGLKPGGTYSLRLDNPIDYSSGPLAGLTLTTRSAGADRSIDSDGEVINMLARATFTLASANPCDHTHDLGFVPLPRRR